MTLTRTRAAAAFVGVFLAALGGLVGGVTALNLALGSRAEGSPAVVVAASEWQQRTHGVTYAPPINNARPFKILRLNDRLPGIDAVMVGASTAMGAAQPAFPPATRMYNFTSAGNPTASIVAEAEAIRRAAGERLCYVVVVLDWVIGPIYAKAPIAPIELTREAALAAVARAPESLPQRLADALSWPKVRNLGKILADVVRSESLWGAFRQAFLQPASDDYPCSDGTPAKDFDTVNRGNCSGYRFDGSWSYYGQKRLRESEIAARVQAAALPSSKFALHLIEAKGVPFRPYLDALAATARELKAQGGTLLVMLPPVLPGIERSLAQSPATGAFLKTTKATLDAWGREHAIAILDAGRSEDFGCSGTEFTDEHHAAPECFARVIPAFWGNDRRLRPGLNGAD